MCGIFGTVHLNNIDKNEVKKQMLHRGPDAQEYMENSEVFLYHFRLSIVDLAGGKQPFSLGKMHLIWNGEIYNHLELREKYNLQGQTHSDTETILLMYQKMGLKMLEEFDGMFAIALYDEEAKKLYLIRDRAGKKPIFYTQTEKGFAYSSELNALQAAVGFEIDQEAINNFLELGFFYRNASPYQGVECLEGGQVLEYDIQSKTYQKSTWWDIHPYYLISEKTLSFEEALNQVDEKLRQAIKRRVDSSDLEVAAFLSGGIDSGLITAIASEFSPTLRTFTVAFDGTFDESSLAELVAQKYGTDHTTIRISFDDLEKDIEKIILQYGLPFFDSSAIPSYYVSREAKKHVTVVLNGDGADELFGGYRRFVPFAKYDFFNTPKPIKSLTKGLKTLLPVSHNKKSLYNYFYRLLNLISQNQKDVYLASTYDLFPGIEDVFIKKPLNQNLEDDFQKIAKEKVSGLDKIMELDFIGPLFGDLLVKMDIATMAHSLEGRSPFLGKELLEIAPTLPDHYKVNGKTTKHILRELAKKYLPEELINQPKRGFEIPLKDWVNGVLKNKIDSYLLKEDAYFLNFIKKDTFLKIYHRKLKLSEERRTKILYLLFVLEVWHTHHYKK
ncbi:MAG: asparagine synthase (glutamine-hydrolyzing) [Flavobacteriales bacterium]|jgi:asparagine synthase (glutamine-hydrolysing)|nr:asparagine synthase (glutamine-hydrolyzing) [Flavobacteriales bacterium]